VVVRKRLHRLFDELVALVFEALAVAELASVDTATEVVILGWGRRRPITISWDNIVDLQLLGDLLDTQMQSVRVQLLGGHGGVNSSRQAHQASSLVLARVAPSVTLLALSRTVRRVALRAAAALQLRQALGGRRRVVTAIIITAETTAST
jgi:hypothetical protein